MIWIGTSGWQYRDWRERFYPRDLPQRAWLTFYGDRFPTVEVNASFYRLPEAETVRRWRDATPGGFLFALKASRYLTHIRRLREPREPVALVLERAQVLGSKLGPILFQLPPRFPADPDRLRALLDEVPDHVRAAVEFRDPSWYRPDVFRILEEAETALVWPDRPGDALDLPLTADHAYLRFHQGRPDAVGYQEETLRRWARRIADLDAREVWVYFNNDPGAAAPNDATTLGRFLHALVPDRVVGRVGSPV